MNLSSSAEPSRRVVHRLLLGLDRVCKLLTITGVVIAALCHVLIMLFVTADIVSTNLFRLPIPVVEEFASTLLAVAIFSAMGFAQYRREHIAVDFFTEGMSAPVRRVFQGATLAIGTAFFALLTWCTGALALTSWQVTETALALIPFPVYPFKLLVLFGSGIATLEFARHFVWHLLGAEVTAETKKTISGTH